MFRLFWRGLGVLVKIALVLTVIGMLLLVGTTFAVLYVPDPTSQAMTLLPDDTEQFIRHNIVDPTKDHEWLASDPNSANQEDNAKQVPDEPDEPNDANAVLRLPCPDDALTFRKQIVAETNQRREQHGLEPLNIYDALMESAQIKANHMHENNYFAHEAPGGGMRVSHITHSILGQDWSFNLLGENLYRSTGHFSPSHIVGGWMKSPSHRETILTSVYDVIGVGCTHGYVVQHFGDLREGD